MKRDVIIILVCLSLILIISISYTITGNSIIDDLFRRTEYISCYDTDNGLDSDEFGSVEANYIEGGEEKTKIFEDKCYNGVFNFFRGDLREFYCRDDNQFAFKYVKCENGCEDGACNQGCKLFGADDSLEIINVGECSNNFKPFYCDPFTKQLILNCTFCGCNEGEECGENEWCGLPVCGKEHCTIYQECINDKCVIKPNIKFGLVYIYNTPDTYNPNWKNDIGEIIPKTEKGLREVTDNKINVSIEILGEVQTDIYCWNPPKIGLKYKSPDGIFDSGRIFTGKIFYDVLPGSSLGTLGDKSEWTYPGKLLELDCDRCKTEIKGEDSFMVSIDCESQGSKENKPYLLKEQISKELNIKLVKFHGFDKFEGYDGVFIVFGRLGRPLDSEERFLEWFCSGMYSRVEATSGFLFSENSLIEPNNYFIDCTKFAYNENNCTQEGKCHGLYQKVGWHTIVHEILHQFGAVDIYNTGTDLRESTENIKTNREKALERDSRAKESIMGDDSKNCIEEGGYEKDGKICTKEELEEVYLDKYNKERIINYLNQ